MEVARVALPVKLLAGEETPIAMMRADSILIRHQNQALQQSAVLRFRQKSSPQKHFPTWCKAEQRFEFQKAPIFWPALCQIVKSIWESFLPNPIAYESRLAFDLAVDAVRILFVAVSTDPVQQRVLRSERQRAGLAQVDERLRGCPELDCRSRSASH